MIFILFSDTAKQSRGAIIIITLVKKIAQLCFEAKRICDVSNFSYLVEKFKSKSTNTYLGAYFITQLIRAHVFALRKLSNEEFWVKQSLIFLFTVWLQIGH